MKIAYKKKICARYDFCLCRLLNALFKLDYSEQFYPNQSFAKFWNPEVKTQRLIPKD
jgi:hypothetical protein